MNMYKRCLFFILCLGTSILFNYNIVEAESITNNTGTYTCDTDDVLIEYEGDSTNIIIPDGIKKIGENVFENNTDIQSISIPTSVIEIEDYAFKGCTSLNNVIIPANVLRIEDGAFEGCTNLSNLTIAEGVTYIGDSAFKRCTSLQNVVIPSTVNKIRASAFASCTNLKSINIPNGITTIYDSVFLHCENLESLVLPDTVNEIRGYAFSYCQNLSSINIPNGIAVISENAFNKCKSLTSITIPESVITIGNSAFYNCTGLTTITIPTNVETIGSEAFGDCSNLKGIIIPDSVQSIGEDAFNDCTALSYISLPNIDNITELGLSNNAIVISDIDYSDVVNKFMYKTLTNNDIEISENSYVYTGTEIKPTVTIKNNTTILDPSFYEITYSNNINVGNATMTITGKEPFSLEPVTFNFTIEENELLKNVVTELNAGSTHSLNINSDEIICTSSNTDVATIDENGTIMCKGVGTTTITLTPIDENSDYTEVSFILEVKNIAPTIITQPIDISTKLNQDVTFTIEATGYNNTYQWYMSTNPLTEGSKIIGANSNTYTIPANSVSYLLDGAYFYCIVSNDSNTEVMSNFAKLTVIAKPTNPVFKLGIQESTWLNKAFDINIIGSKIGDSEDNVGYKYSLDGGVTWKLFNIPITWDTDTKSTTILAYAYNLDYPDIKSDTVPLVFSYDATAPEVNDVEIDNFTVKVNAIDITSGINTYSIEDENGNAIIEEQTSNTFSINTKGNYIATVTDNAGNVAYSEPFAVEQNPDTCEHNTDLVKNTKEPTCCEKGYSGDLYCSICDTLQENGIDIDATGKHTTEIRNQKESSCTEKGYTGDIWCTVGDKLVQLGEEIEADKCNNSVITNSEEPTCCSNGYTGDKHCSGCNSLQEEGEIIPATNEHTTEIRNAKEPSCTEKGYTGDTWCTVGDKLIQAGEKINESDCNKEVVRKAKTATCCTEGYTGDLYCSKCNTLQEEGIIIEATNDHTIEIRDCIESTCTIAGYTGDTYCSNSGKLLEKGKFKELLKHNTDLVKDKKEPTCGEPGYTGDKYCSVCDTLQEKGEYIKATENHIFNNGIITQEATTDTDGKKEFTCTVCNHTKIETINKLPKEESTEIIEDYTAQINAAKAKKATISKLTNKKGKKLVVKLKKANGYSFEIQVSTNKKFKKSVKTYKTSKNSYTVKKLKKGKKYYVKVRTYKKIEGKTYYGKWSKVKSIKIKK